MMIIRYGYYFDRTKGRTTEETLHVNVFAFSRDKTTGMVMFGHSFYKGDVVEFHKMKPRLRMTALKRMIYKPYIVYLQDSDNLDEYCKVVENQRRIAQHMSIDGSLKFDDDDNAYKHYRPFAIVYMLVKTLRHKTNGVSSVSLSPCVMRQINHDEHENIKVSNVKFRIIGKWLPASNKLSLACIGGANGVYIVDQAYTVKKTEEQNVEEHYLNTMFYKNGEKVHFSEVSSSKLAELTSLGLNYIPRPPKRVSIKCEIPKGVHIFHWNSKSSIIKMNITVAFIPDIENGSLVYSFCVIPDYYKMKRNYDWRRIGNHIAINRTLKNPIYMICDADNSSERRDAIKQRIKEHFVNGKSLGDYETTMSSFISSIMYPLDLFANWIISKVYVKQVAC